MRFFVNLTLTSKGTLYTINYLVEIIHQLLPLEHMLEDKLICHMIECLTHTKLRFEHDEYEIDENSERDDEEKETEARDESDSASREDNIIVIHNSGKKMQTKQFLVLHKLIRELCHDPLQFVVIANNADVESMTTSDREDARRRLRRSKSQDDDDELERSRQLVVRRSRQNHHRHHHDNYPNHDNNNNNYD